jgi:hypothetical protein
VNLQNLQPGCGPYTSFLSVPISLLLRLTLVGPTHLLHSHSSQRSPSHPAADVRQRYSAAHDTYDSGSRRQTMAAWIGRLRRGTSSPPIPLSHSRPHLSPLSLSLMRVGAAQMGGGHTARLSPVVSSSGCERPYGFGFLGGKVRVGVRGLLDLWVPLVTKPRRVSGTDAQCISWSLR